MTLDLDHLSSLCEKATPGPWSAEPVCEGRLWAIHETLEDDPPLATVGPHGNNDGEDNANFIATARTALPLLVEEVERLRSVLQEAVADVVTTHDAVGHPLNPPLPKWVEKARAALKEPT